MDELLSRILENLHGRIDGPMKLRLLLQPAMAIFFAIRSGLMDARDGKPAFFWAVFAEPKHRRELLRDGWKSVGKVFLAALAMDAIYQVVVLRWIYPGEMLLVATALAIIPYLAVRGPVNRIVQALQRNRAASRAVAGRGTAKLR